MCLEEWLSLSLQQISNVALHSFFVAEIVISTAMARMAWQGACVIMTLLGAYQTQVSAVAFQHSSFTLSRGLRGLHMTSCRNDGYRRTFEVKHGTKCWGRPSLSLTEDSARESNTFSKALSNSAGSKVNAQGAALFFTKIAVALGCFAGLFLQDVTAQEYNAVNRFPLVDQGKVRRLDLR